MNQTYTDFIKNKPVETVFRIHAILLSIFAIQKLLSKKVDKHTLQIKRKQIIVCTQLEKRSCYYAASHLPVK